MFLFVQGLGLHLLSQVRILDKKNKTKLMKQQ